MLNIVSGDKLNGYPVIDTIRETKKVEYPMYTLQCTEDALLNLKRQLNNSYSLNYGTKMVNITSVSDKCTYSTKCDGVYNLLITTLDKHVAINHSSNI